MSKPKESLCSSCRDSSRISAGLRVCECGKEMSWGEMKCCAGCARKKGVCQWCGAKLASPKRRRK